MTHANQNINTGIDRTGNTPLKGRRKQPQQSPGALQLVQTDQPTVSIATAIMD